MELQKSKLVNFLKYNEWIPPYWEEVMALDSIKDRKQDEI